MNGCRILTAAEPERDVSCRLNAAIQVSMEPAIGGAIDTAGFPIASYHLVAFATLKRTHSQFFWPHIDIPLRTNDEKDGTRGVIVGFVIDSRRPFRNMANEAVIRHFEAGDPSLGNFVRRVVDGGDPRVSDKVRIPHTGPSRLVTPVAHRKIRIFSVVTGLEHMVAVENKVRVAEKIHDNRRR